MALEDIIRRIEEDADREAAEIVEGARREAQEAVQEAKRRAAALREEVLEASRSQAARERETDLANARLRARDRTLAARLELSGRALREAETALVGLDDAEYASLLARAVAASARGGETVLIADADRERLGSRLAEAVAAEIDGEIALAYGDEDPGISHGILLAGERTSVEISPARLVEARREEIMGLIAKVLFEADDGEGPDG